MVEQFIIVEGPIGVGKTTLAARIAESMDARMVADPEMQNPFLERYYNSSGGFALQTQLDFLIRRIDLLNLLVDADFEENAVSDYLVAKDRLFAQVTLNEDELWIYDRIHACMQQPEIVPSLVIYLQASPEILMDRIESRGVGFEQRMASGYLQRICDAYSQFFHEYTDTPLLIVNAEDVNFADNKEDYQNLLDQIESISAGRHYLNPLPA